MPDADAVVLHQVARRLRRAVPFQISRRCAQQAPIGSDLAGDDARVGRLAETHADIEGIVRQRRRVDRELQLDLHLGMGFAELRDHRCDVAAAKAQRRIHAQKAFRLRHRLRQLALDIADVRQDAPRVRQIGLAFGRQADAARGAV